MLPRAFVFVLSFALVLSIVVLAASLTVNPWPVSLFRAGLALIAGGFTGYVFSHLWRWISADLNKTRGTHVDYTIESTKVPSSGEDLTDKVKEEKKDRNEPVP